MGVLMTDALPEEISERLQSFLVRRPSWTQARVMQNALSLFLLQNGVNDRAVPRLYLESMFPESAPENGGVQ
mgnify:CR=1 FL=1